MTRIALDAMGGDNAPGEIVVGAVESAVGLRGVKILLVGQLAAVQAELDKLPKDLKSDAQSAIESGKLEIVHAPDKVEMDESPVDAVRKKKDCSINVAMRLVKDGRADAFVSAGNSGAVATSAIFNLGRIPGVARPAIAAVLPTRIPRRPILVLDAGANMDCHPDWLVQFAIMGNAYRVYERLSLMENIPDDMKQMSLAIARDVHEIKKDYNNEILLSDVISS